MFKRVSNRYWFRIVWALVVMIGLATSTHGSTLLTVITIVVEVLLLGYLVVTVIEIRTRLRDPKAEPAEEPPPIRWNGDWISPATIGVLVVVFIAAFVIARVLAPS